MTPALNLLLGVLQVALICALLVIAFLGLLMAGRLIYEIILVLREAHEDGRW